MKKSIYLIAIAVSIMTIACKKEKAVSINGYWTGTATTTGASTVYFSILYKADGTARGFSGNPDTTIATAANGTYSIDADSVRTNFALGFGSTALAGKLNSATNQMTGTFRSLSGSSHGTFLISK